jgi:tetratricopeptide (TPR) repeat protein
MASVLELLYTSDDEEVIAWCKRLEKRKSTQLKLQASALRGMPVKQRESLLDTARRHVEVWQSPSVLKVTGDTTFDAASIRAENATVYLKVTLEDVERYASVLRVLIGQLLFKLYRVAPESDAPVVTFFLDELPRLGRLDVIEQSLDMGRGYGVRLWLFCQNLGQLQTAYPNAQGMMSNCAIRCFMNPDEDAARWLSDNLGTRHGLLDGTRKPLVEPHQLTGPEFAHQVVVFSRGQLPARLDKKPAFADAVCNGRVNGSDQREEPTGASGPLDTGADNAAPSSAGTADGKAVDWDEVPDAIPASLLSPQLQRASYGSGRVLGAAVAFLLVAAGLVAWIIRQGGELQALRAEMGSLASALETSTQSLAREKASWIESVRTSEQARGKLAEEADGIRQALALEQRNHAATRARLANAQRDLDEERSRAVVRAAPPVPQPAPMPAPQPAPAVPQAPPLPPTASQPNPAPQTSVFPDSTKQSLPNSVLLQIMTTDCDRLAANPNDPRRIGMGVKYPDLKRNVAAAIEACDRALATSPNEQRLLYQKARALYAASDSRARSLFDQLMNAGYPSAFDNAAQYLIREGKSQEAEGLLRRGVQLQDPDAMVTLADAIRAGSMPARTIGEDIILYEMAAKLGHQGAKSIVEQLRAVGNFVAR